MRHAVGRARPALRLVPACMAVALFVGVGAAGLIALLRESEPVLWPSYVSDPYLWRLVQFSLGQAALSSLISLLLAVPVTSCLRHREFWGRAWLLQGFALSMVVPTMVAVLGIVVVYGRSGWLNQWFGVEVPLYGLGGILLAHVFFNMPLAVRLLLQGQALVPGGQWRLAAQLGLGRWAAFWLVEWPYLRRVLPGAWVLVFVLCFSSFSVVLSLGGGPRSSTLEVAIYQALRFDFDIGKATFLALLQVVICTAVALAAYRLLPAVRPDTSALPLRAPHVRDSLWARGLDASVMALALWWVVPPFVAIFDPVFSARFLPTVLDPATASAVGVSLALALPAGVLSVALGYAFGSLARAALDNGRWAWLPTPLEQLGDWILLVPGLVLATGLFLLLRNAGWGLTGNYLIVVWVNAVMALPFVLRALMPAMIQHEKRFRRMHQSLGIWGWSRLMLEWPLLRRNVGQALGYAVLLSLGDMGVIALFGTQGLVSLPLYLYQLVGSYRLQEGASVAVVLMALCAVLFYACTRGVGGKGHAGV